MGVIRQPATFAIISSMTLRRILLGSPHRGRSRRPSRPPLSKRRDHSRTHRDNVPECGQLPLRTCQACASYGRQPFWFEPCESFCAPFQVSSVYTAHVPMEFDLQTFRLITCKLWFAVIDVDLTKFKTTGVYLNTRIEESLACIHDFLIFSMGRNNFQKREYDDYIKQILQCKLDGSK